MHRLPCLRIALSLRRAHRGTDAENHGALWALKNVRTAYKSGRARCRINSSAARLFHDVKQSTLLTVTTPVFVVMYYSHPFRLAKTSLAKQSTSHCVVFDTQADFVGAIEHIAPMAITNSPEISVKSGLFAGAMCSIAPYAWIAQMCKNQ